VYIRLAGRGDRTPDPATAGTASTATDYYIVAPAETARMFRRARESGPALLIPSAWGLVAAVHLGVVTTRPVFVMHAVMSVLLVAFAAASWREMDSGVLRAWRAVIVAGTPFAVAGLAGFVVPDPPAALFALALFGWMLLPAAGFGYTARELSAGAWVYAAAAAGCPVGTGLYAYGALAGSPTAQIAGLAVVGAAQTAGIVDAVVRF